MAELWPRHHARTQSSITHRALRGLLVIGASTGAPRLHHVYLQAAPHDFGIPIVIVQHLPPGPFIDGMLRYLGQSVSMPCTHAEDGAPLAPGQVFVVRPGTRLLLHIRPGYASVSPDPRRQSPAPSMNTTFCSAARAFGPRVCIAMLSGLHADIDGLRGCEAVRAAGGHVIVTDPATTPCYSMIRQLRMSRAVDDECPLSELLPTVSHWLRGKS